MQAYERAVSSFVAKNTCTQQKKKMYARNVTMFMLYAY